MYEFCLTPPLTATGGSRMEKEKLLKCPTGYELECTEDHDQDRYCCCCTRVEASSEEFSRPSSFWSLSLPAFSKNKHGT